MVRLVFVRYQSINRSFMKTLSLSSLLLTSLILMILSVQSQGQEKSSVSIVPLQQGETPTSEGFLLERLQRIHPLKWSVKDILSRLESNSSHKLDKKALTAAQGYSYITILPFVSRQSGVRTNLGLNNFTQSSIINGDQPSANVLIFLVDQQGAMAGSKTYVVGFNELLQINDVITDLQGDVDWGWLYILSDEPLSAWASVILNSTNDPSIELGTRFGGQRLAIQSSAKTNTFISSLIILNLGNGGNVKVRIYDPQGQEISSKDVFIQSFGLYLDDDIRQEVPGTFGQIVIEAVDSNPYLMASSIVKSTNGTGAFFPATSLPSVNVRSIAGVWEGNLVGTTINAQIRVILNQEGSYLFGSLNITGGTFPTSSTSISISGFVISDATYQYVLESDDHLDSAVSFYTLNLYAPPVTGVKMSGKTLYADEKGLRETGTFVIDRTGDISIN